MKIKGTLEFIVVLIVALLLYFVFILNIDKITTSYHGKLEEYKNIYYKEAREPDILYELQQTGEYYYEEITSEAMESIRSNKVIRNILMKFGNLKENEIEGYIEKLEASGQINFAKGDIVYIVTENYDLAFSLDMNNLIYQRRENEERSVNWENKDITIESKYTIYERTARELQKLGITEKFKFEPETIYFRYAVEEKTSSDVYAVEDNKHNIKLVVSTPDYTIEKIQIGFTQSLVNN